MSSGRFPEDYQFPDDFPPWRWAWEFLRRNPEYQQGWKQALSEHAPQDARETRRRDFAFREYAAECLEKWWLRPGYVNPTLRKPLISFDRTFGGVTLGGPPGPSQVKRSYVGGVRAGDVEPNRFAAYAQFDLTIPIGRQIPHVEKILKDIKRRLPGLPTARPKLHRSLLPFYIFLLDCADCDLGPTDIANKLEWCYPSEPDKDLDEQKVRERLKAARKLTQPSGYLSLIY